MYPQLDHFLAKGCSQKLNKFYHHHNQSPPIFEKPFKSMLNVPSSLSTIISPSIPNASEFQFVSPGSMDYSSPSRRNVFTSPKPSQSNHEFRAHGVNRFAVMHKQKNKEIMEKMKDLNSLMEEATLNAGKI